jgi:hypothetical protein
VIKICRLTACLLIIGLLVLPAALSTKGKRGATLVVTRLDGTLVSGELIAVKLDSLPLLDTGAADLSVDFGDIPSVRIVRRSKIGKGVLYGFLGGALGGAVWGAAPTCLCERWARCPSQSTICEAAMASEAQPRFWVSSASRNAALSRKKFICR